jgi:N-hydroxyarylamine O-acetyltransferase
MQRDLILGGYLQALGLQKRTADLAFLNEITRGHVSQFSFSSVGPMLGDELPLDLESLYQRIVLERRGGYCFEQNGLMFGLLEDLGYSVELYLGRVIYNEDIHPGLTHRITRVGIGGSQYIVDVGFGPLGPSQAVSMSGEISRQGFRQFRILQRRPGEFHMQTLKDGDFYSLYKFELHRYGQADCEVGHFYSHKHPKASFVNHLVVSRILDQEVRSLRDLEFRVITPAIEQKTPIENVDHLRSVLRKQFNIEVSSTESSRLFNKCG